MFKAAFGQLQRIGMSLMLPVAVLPVAGLLLGIGSSNFPFLPMVVSHLMAQGWGCRLRQSSAHLCRWRCFGFDRK